MTKTVEHSYQRVLENELEKLKKILKTGYELRVRWLPNSSNQKISGEVKNNHIYIYDEDKKVALDTLRHEFLDFVISQVIIPYRDVANRLLDLVNEIAYRRKEQLVESLIQFVYKGI